MADTVLTSAELLKLAGMDFGKSMTRGALAYHRRTLQRAVGPVAAAQRRLIQDLEATPTREKSKTAPPPIAATSGGARKPFSQADLMWLDRLPTDPAKITAADFKQLQRLQAQAELGSGDARLVRSIVEPVLARLVGDSARAEVDRLRANAPAGLPASFAEVLAETIRAENPVLQSYEASSLATARLGEAVRVRDAEFAGGLREAERAVERADQDRAKAAETVVGDGTGDAA